MDKTVVHVGEELLQRKALLLPAVHDFFLERYDEMIAEVSNLQGAEKNTSITSLWILSNLTNALQHHLVYTCKARKYGTLLYRPNTNLVALLQQSLSKLTENLANTTWLVEGNSSPQPDPMFSCNAEEADTMLWLHAKQTQCNQILVLSPDTDVYMIGLPLQCTQDKDIIIQISDRNSREAKLLHMRQLIIALSNDPDLASVETTLLPKILQTLFVVTGCDYISFFSGIGKARFLRYFFMAC